MNRIIIQIATTEDTTCGDFKELEEAVKKVMENHKHIISDLKVFQERK